MIGFSRSAAISVLFFVGVLSASAETDKRTMEAHSWGKSAVTARGDGSTVLSVSFDLESVECPEGEAPPKILFFALNSSEKISATVISYETTPLPSAWVTVPSSYRATADSSMLAPVFEQGLQQKFFSTLPIQPLVKIAGYGWFRNYFVARIEISPYVVGSGANSIRLASHLEIALKRTAATAAPARPKIKSDPQFESTLRDLIVNYEDARPYQMSSLNDSTGGWFNTSSLFAKLGIATDGIYRLTAEEMKSMFPSLGDPSTIRLYHNGAEVPIFVQDANSNNLFDSTDYVEFPALRNYTGLQRKVSSGTEEYHDYLNRYTDTSYYWITLDSSPGLRAAINPAPIAQAETLKSYTAYVHLEESGAVGLQFCGPLDVAQDPRYTAGDFWPWAFMNANNSPSANFTASDIDLSGDSVTVYSKLMGWGADLGVSPAHIVSIRLNGAVDLSQVSLDEYDQAVLRGRAPVSKLLAGNNTISIFSKPTAATTLNSCVYDWFEAEYPRKLAAVSDSLMFDFRMLTDRRVRTIQVSNLTSQDIALYKVQPVVQRISNVSFSPSAPYTLTFSDTVGANDVYILAATSRVLTPYVSDVKHFVGLRNNKQQTDYVIITHSKFKTEAEQYRQYVAAAQAFSARLVDVEDIYDEFGYGYPTPESMQAYLRSTMLYDSPPPSYLFLIGDASYDYKYYDGNRTAINYVPSYGYPVSDALLTVWDDIGFQPQMFVGRLPVNNVGEVTQYLNRVKAYNAFPNDDWNKKYLFFTGGDPGTPGQIEQLKAPQDSIIRGFVSPAPIGGIATHFYKTINPQTDFGPYSTQQIRDAIAAGAVFISYIGHSGPETWDNSIGDPTQLENSRGRFPLITDLGCSTVKFAEPLTKSFGEDFVIGPGSSAIAYIGNSALGYTTTATTLPIYLYSKILRDSVRTIGKAHTLAKIGLANTGFSFLNRIMLYTNTLIGDPSVNLAVPFTPNLVETPSLIFSQDPSPTDQPDSTAVSIVAANYGSVTKDSIDVRIEQSYSSQVLRTVSVRRPMPLVYDTIRVMIATKNKPGEHRITVTLDPQNKIAELSKQDNSATTSIFVASSDFRIVQPIPLSISSASRIVLLNPSTLTGDSAQSVVLQVDTSQAFASPKRYTAPMGSVATSFDISTLTKPRRYWWRANILQGEHTWTLGTFYLGIASGTIIGQADSVGWSDNAYVSTEYGSDGNARLQKLPLDIRAISSGAIDGNFGVVEFNGVNVLQSSTQRGHSVVELDPVSYNVLGVRNFDTYGGASQVTALTNYLDSIPAGHLVVAVIIDEGVNNLSTDARAAYKTIGSKYADSLQQQRTSWAIIGRKGAPVGSVPEMMKAPGTGKAIIDTTVVKIESQGSIATPLVGPTNGWKQLSIAKTSPAGALLKTSIVGSKSDGSIDTLVASSSDSSFSLLAISPKQYSKLRLVFSFTVNALQQSPTIGQWTMNVIPPVELATSTGNILLSKSTLQEGEIDTVKVKVFNVGGSKADSVEAQLSSNDAGPYRVIQSFSPFALASGDSILLVAYYDTRGRRGSHSFLFQVDPQNKLADQYVSNNSVTIPYTVLSDTIRPSLDITFDDTHVVDGDFVRARPSVLFQLRDLNGAPIAQSDTSIIHIDIDNNQVYFGGNSSIQFTAGSPPLIAEVRWTPQLTEGDHTLRYFAKDAAGNSSDTTLLFVRVASRLELTNVYNIPNPFGNGTTFTFILAGTDDPQSAHIKIYTVAGRLIQDLDISSRVHIGANGYKNSSDNLYWDGRDRDGNEIANGIYLYRVIIKGGGQQTATTQKLVKMR